MNPGAVVFDMDETLAESFKPPMPDTVALFEQLLKRLPVAIMTGASFKRTKEHFLDSLSPESFSSRIYLFVDSSAQCFLHTEGEWRPQYSVTFSPEHRREIEHVLRVRFAESGIAEGYPVIGEQLIVRDSQVTLAALGYGMDRETKERWDPDRTKRMKLVHTLEQDLPECDIKIGGLTAIDISPKGIDKTYGIYWLAHHLGIAPSEMLYIGDAFYPGGNDAAVIPTGIQWKSVQGPADTRAIIAKMLESC